VYGVGPHRLEFPDMKKLSISTTAGSDGHHRLEAVDSWAYWYTRSPRASSTSTLFLRSQGLGVGTPWGT
jgi:hypothetical protein